MIASSKTQFDVALLKIGAPEAEPSDAELIAGILADGGLDVSSEVIFQLEGLIVARSYQRAGAVLGSMLLLLPSTPQNMALRLAVQGSRVGSITESAKVARCSRQNLSKHTRKMRDKIKLVAG